MYQSFDGEWHPSWVAMRFTFSSRRALLVAENELVNTIMLFLRKSRTPEGNCHFLLRSHKERHPQESIAFRMVV